MKRRGILLLLLTLVLSSAWAQKRVARNKTAAVVVAKAKTNNANSGRQLYSSMLSATAKVMFIDSVVVGKYDFLSHVPLNAESGKFSVKSNKFGRKLMPLTQYETELGDRRFYAVGDTVSTALYMQTKVGNAWGQQTCLADLDDKVYRWQDFPFLAADGITLFFSAKGTHSMGGRDIFMTSYDADKDEWLQPQNYGLPFNSTSNDYLLAIDELDTLGWLVTDRRQHEDSVCIYTFVPTQVRKDFTDENLSGQQIERYAQIRSIADTWKFGDRQAALKRRNIMLRRMNDQARHPAFSFILNDETVITDENQLKSNDARQLLRQWLELEGMIVKSQHDLENLRGQYTRGNHALSNQIISEEKSLMQQQTDLNDIAKRLRQAELLNK